MKLHEERDTRKKDRRIHRVGSKDRWRYKESDYIDEDY